MPSRSETSADTSITGSSSWDGDHCLMIKIPTCRISPVKCYAKLGQSSESIIEISCARFHFHSLGAWHPCIVMWMKSIWGIVFLLDPFKFVPGERCWGK